MYVKIQNDRYMLICKLYMTNAEISAQDCLNTVKNVQLDTIWFTESNLQKEPVF